MFFDITIVMLTCNLCRYKVLWFFYLTVTSEIDIKVALTVVPETCALPLLGF